MRATEEELPQLAKGHQGNSNKISEKLRISSVGLANWNTRRLVLAPAPRYALFRPRWAVSRRGAEVGFSFPMVRECVGPSLLGYSQSAGGLSPHKINLKLLLHQDLQPIECAFSSCEFQTDNNDPSTTIEAGHQAVLTSWR